MTKLQSWMSLARETDGSLAPRVGVSRVQVSRVRRGVNLPSTSLALKLETVTGIPAWEFLNPPEADRASKSQSTVTPPALDAAAT